MCLEVLKPVSHHLLIVVIIGHLTCVSSQTICACKNETDDILQELQILKSITKSLQQNVSTLMSEREILQKNLTQLQELGLNKIPSHSLTVMQDDLKGIDNSVTANQHQITSLKDDLVYIHTLTRNTTAILQNISNDCQTKVRFTSRNSGKPTLADNEKIVFDIVVSNFGKGYDPKTGIFTAVKSGTYLLFADVRTHWNDNTCWIDLVRNGSPVTTVFIASDSKMSSDSTLAILHLDIGNKVWLRKKPYDGVCRVDNHLTFSGYLLNVN